MAQVGKELFQELQRLYQTPRITFERGLMQTEDDSALGFVSDMSNFEITDGGMIKRRAGSKVLNNSPFLTQNRWHFIKSFNISGATVILGLNMRREMYAWLMEYPEVDFLVCRRGVQPEFLKNTANTTPTETMQMCFTRGGKFWILDDEQYVYVCNDFGDAYRINKRGYFQIDLFRDNPSFMSTSTKALSLAVAHSVAANNINYVRALYLDIKDATNKLPDTFHLLEDRYRRTVPIDGGVRVAYRNECGAISEFSDPIVLPESKSVIVSRFPGVTTKSEDTDYTEPRLTIDADFNKLTYRADDPDAATSTTYPKLFVNRRLNLTKNAFYFDYDTTALTNVLDVTDTGVLPRKCTIFYIKKILTSGISGGDIKNASGGSLSNYDPYLFGNSTLSEMEDTFWMMVDDDDATTTTYRDFNIDSTDESFGNFIRLEDLRYFGSSTEVATTTTTITDDMVSKGSIDTFIEPLATTVGSGINDIDFTHVGWEAYGTATKKIASYYKDAKLFDGQPSYQLTTLAVLYAYGNLATKKLYKLHHLGFKPTFSLPMELEVRNSGEVMYKQVAFFGNIMYANVRMKVDGSDFHLQKNAMIYNDAFWYNSNCYAMNYNWYNTWNILEVGAGKDLPLIVEATPAFSSRSYLEVDPVTKAISYYNNAYDNTTGIAPDVRALIPLESGMGAGDKATDIFMDNADRFVVWNEGRIISESQRGWYNKDAAGRRRDFIYDHPMADPAQRNRPPFPLRKQVCPISSLDYQSIFGYDYAISEVRTAISNPQFMAMSNKHIFVIQRDLLYVGGTDLMLTNFTAIPHTVVGMHEFYDGVLVLTHNGFYRVNQKLELHLINDSSNITVKASVAGNGGVYTVASDGRIHFTHMVYTASGTPAPVVEWVNQQMYSLSFGNIPKMAFVKDTLYIATDYEIYGLTGQSWTKKYYFDGENIDGIGEVDGELIVWFNNGTTKVNLFNVPIGFIGG